MALNLSGVQRTVEGFLTDSVQLWRDLRGESDDVLDEGSGVLQPGSAVEVVWEGVGAVVPSGMVASSSSLDGSVAQVNSDTAYHGLLPLSIPRVLVDDVLTVVESARDGLLAGRRFRVTAVSSSSFAVVRVVGMQLLGT